ncbi:MAG: archease [Desulfurococcales archaeon]|nr:archease [Desulfurococcales archaeon]
MAKIVDMDHTADVMYIVEAEDLERLFEYAAIGMFRYMTPDLSRVSPIVGAEVSSRGFDLENLLYRWLEDLLILHDLRGLVFSRFLVKGIYRVEEDGEQIYMLKGYAAGERFDPRRHISGIVVKAVTYSQMALEKTQEGIWRVSIVLDI